MRRKSFATIDRVLLGFYARIERDLRPLGCFTFDEACEFLRCIPDRVCAISEKPILHIG